MARAVLAHGHAAVGRADLHIQMGVADGVADLLISTSGSEHGKGGSKGDQAAGGQSRRHAHHIRLGDAAVEMTVGVRFGKHAGFRGACQVGVQHHNVLMLRAQGNQPTAVALAGGHFFDFCHLTCPPVRSVSASAPPWPGHTARRWARRRAIRPGFP